MPKQQQYEQTELDLAPDEIEEMVEKEQLPPNQARLYVQEALEISRHLYYKYIYPKIKGCFSPYFINRDERGKVRGASAVRISKQKLDEVIASHKKKVEDKARG